MQENFKSRNWHYNFRNKKLLPDIAILQREFYISMAALGLGALMMLFYFWGLIGSMSLSKELNTLQDEVTRRTPLNDTYLQQSESFKSYAQVVDDLALIYEPSIDPVYFLTTVSETAPTELIFSNIVFNETSKNHPAGFLRSYQIKLEGYIKATDNVDAALKTINRFQTNMLAKPFFEGAMEDFDVTNVTRDASSGQVNFTIIIKLQVQAS